ncbi:MAG: phosphate acetyltransferase [Proteobacteria bacterium]|nr:phosphate acetyltransferase [Pseudomonadota bacterium]
MHKKIYLTGIEKKPGKTFVSLGFLSLLKEQFPDLNCYKLFAEEEDTKRNLVEHIIQAKLKPIMPIQEAIELMHNDPEGLISSILEFIPEDENDEGFAYFDGSDFESDNDLFEYQFNLNLAYQLNCAVILVISAKNRTLSHTQSLLKTALEIAKKNHTQIAGVIINRATFNENDALTSLNKQFKNLPFTAIIPEFEELANPSVRDVANKLKAQILLSPNELNRSVKEFTIAAKTVGNFLQSRLDRDGMLIITPDDRIDILLGALLADQSSNYPKIAGLVLTGGKKPNTIIKEIIEGLEHSFPVLLTKLKTYETATTLFSAQYSLSLEDPEKIKKALSSIRPYLTELIVKIVADKAHKAQLTPAIFLHDLMIKAKKLNRHIVLPEGNDNRILMAADYLLKKNIVNITLLGNPDKIQTQAKRLGLELPDVKIIDIEKSPKKESYAETYFELRKHKNVNLPIALERVTDVNYFAAMMVYAGDADGMVSGAMHTTADTVRPALEIIKTKKDVKLVSSVFIMCMPSRVLIYGDCAINPEPDKEALAEIAIQASDIATKLGIEPRVALLSYSSGASGKGLSVEKVRDAAAIVKKKAPNLLIEGPIQYDAAVDPEVALKKLPNSKLAGDANVLIFPDLNTGNNTYKAVQRETGSLAVGPVLLGLNKPVNDLSRGCTPEDIINTILVTVIQTEGS